MSKEWIRFPKTSGTASRQAHCDLPAGTFEREMGKEGFFGPATHFYHAHPPTGWTDFEGPLRPHAFDTTKLHPTESCPCAAHLLLSNAHVRVSFWSVDVAMGHVFRNADGDLLLFIHNGTGDFYCDFGHMTYRDGDYICLPRGTMWRMAPAEKTDILLIESTNGHLQLPDKGLLGPHALFDPAALETPVINEKFLAQQDSREWKVRVKRRHQISVITYPFSPLDAKGWKGDLVPVRINWRDIRPVMSHRYHLPPSVHTTFVGNRFVVCTFVPRPFETDEGALKVPFFHNNDDFDEVLFYHRGEFFSRDNIHPGMMTLHPSGFTHGPHPKALQNAGNLGGKHTNEVAVMIDTRDALDISPECALIEWEGYVNSWRGGDKAGKGEESA